MTDRTKMPAVFRCPPDAPREVLEAAALGKLRRLLRLRRDHAGEISAVGLRLLDTCIVACIAEARARGAGWKARAVIEEMLR